MVLIVNIETNDTTYILKTKTQLTMVFFMAIALFTKLFMPAKPLAPPISPAAGTLKKSK